MTEPGADAPDIPGVDTAEFVEEAFGDDAF